MDEKHHRRLAKILRNVGSAAEPLAEIISAGIATVRIRDHGWTLAQLAERVSEIEGSKVETGALQKTEAGSWPKPGRLRSIAQALGIPAFRLFDPDYLSLPPEGRRELDQIREYALSKHLDGDAPRGLEGLKHSALRAAWKALDSENRKRVGSWFPAFCDRMKPTTARNLLRDTLADLARGGDDEDQG